MSLEHFKEDDAEGVKVRRMVESAGLAGFRGGILRSSKINAANGQADLADLLSGLSIPSKGTFDLLDEPVTQAQAA